MSSSFPLVEWRRSQALVPYPYVLQTMEERVQAIATHQAFECLWTLEHPPLYTAGTSAIPSDLLGRHCLPVFATGRGGQYTYHGPGQRIAYVMLNLATPPSQQDVRYFVWQLEEWLIQTLQHFHITGERRSGRVGIWIALPSGREAKIAAIGIRIRKWITYHGIALNVAPHLEHYQGIVPCGIRDYGITSLAALGVKVTMEEVDSVLSPYFSTIFSRRFA